MSKLIRKSEKIFIAGSSGMVGRAIKNSLLKAGYGDEFKGGNILSPSREILDLENSLKVENWFKKNKPSIVIIAAAKVGGIHANNVMPYEFLIKNLKIQNNLIEQSYANNVKRLLFLGSSCIYPKFSQQPIMEEYLLTDILEKTNEYYALAKITGIKLCQSLRIQYGFDAISLMPTNLYGPGDNYHPLNSHVLPALINKIYDAKLNSNNQIICWGSGKPLREFLYVDDLADACLFALENWDPDDGNAPKDIHGENLYWLNVGSQYEVSIKELVDLIANECDFHGEINWDLSKPDGTGRKKLDTSRMSYLGWEAKVNLKEGIKRTIGSYLIEKEKNILRT
tara:strand:- start:146 stop:1162 length:1017 start_codon:yes stop_codon:yes gene_type:complete